MQKVTLISDWDPSTGQNVFSVWLKLYKSDKYSADGFEETRCHMILNGIFSPPPTHTQDSTSVKSKILVERHVTKPYGD